MLRIYFNILFHLQEPMHIRALARKTNLTPPLLSRRLEELEKENIVDYRREGRNKIYFKKESFEAKTYEKMLEHYKVLTLPFKELIEAIQADKQISLAIVFGSYAKGTHNRQSDIDLFIQSDDIALRDEYKKRFPKLHVILGDFSEQSRLKQEILENHVIIKGFDHNVY